MPVPYKILVSILALAVTAGVFYFDTQAGAGGERWVALLLGPLMIFGIWVFPEAKQKKPPS